SRNRGAPLRQLRLWLSVAFMLPVFAAGALAQPDLANFAPLGRMVTVDEIGLHLYCAGTGKPTVLLEEGAGGGSPYWAWIQRAVAKVTRVCSYDRPGYGWSDSDDGPRDATAVVRRLTALLNAANETGPYLAVGHSLGGAYLRLFADRHREELAGLVLVDATS